VRSFERRHRSAPNAGEGVAEELHPNSLRSLLPPRSGHHEKQESDSSHEPTAAGSGTAAGVTRGADDEYDENPHEHESGDPSQRGRRPAPARLGQAWTRTTATIGMGLSATAAAAGNNSPTARVKWAGPQLRCSPEGITNGRWRARHRKLVSASQPWVGGYAWTKARTVAKKRSGSVSAMKCPDRSKIS
jgi:hypothetical protein